MNPTIPLIQNYRTFPSEKPWYYEFLDIIEHSPIITSIIALFILMWIFKKSEKDFHSNWNTLLDNFSHSTEDFYELLKQELSNRGITNLRMINKSLNQDSIGYVKRKYLQITWKDYDYYVCAAPFGKGFFVSWHLVYKDSPFQIFIAKTPFVGNWLVDKLFAMTFYQRDTASMFMTYTHQSVLKVIENITTEQGVRLTEQEKKPILNNIFKR